MRPDKLALSRKGSLENSKQDSYWKRESFYSIQSADVVLLTQLNVLLVNQISSEESVWSQIQNILFRLKKLLAYD